MGSSPLTGDRLVVITDDDHSGAIWVVAILCCIYTIAVMLLRAEARRKAFGLDDWLTLAATIFAVAQYCVIFVATSRGLGKSFLSIMTPSAEVVGRLLSAGDVLLLIALFFSKSSLVFLCRRLFSLNMKNHIIVCDMVMAICGFWCLTSVLVLSIKCSPLGRMNYGTAVCSGLITRWKVIGIFNAVTELLICGLAVVVVWPLQMSVSRKIPVIMSFCPRLALVALAGLHIDSVVKAVGPSAKGLAGVRLANPIIYLQVQLFYAVFSCTIPAVNGWLRNFTTAKGGSWYYGSGQYGTEQYQDMSRATTKRDSRATEAFAMPILSRNRTRQNSIAVDTSTNPRAGHKSLDNQNIQDFAINRVSNDFRPNRHTYVATASGGAGGRKESNTTETDGQSARTQETQNSEVGIIRKDVQWDVQYENDVPVNQFETGELQIAHGHAI